MTREIPGTAAVAGRRFLYMQARDLKDSLDAFRKVGDLLESRGPFPRGGMTTENVKIAIPDGRFLFGISFKGDLEAWENGVRALGRSERRGIGEIDAGTLRLDDGTTVDLGVCKIEFFQQLPR